MTKSPGFSPYPSRTGSFYRCAVNDSSNEGTNNMLTITRGLAAGGALIAAAVGLANPASAETLDGMYSITVTDGGGVLAPGSRLRAFVSPCGTDCAHIVTPSWSTDAHLQGNTWSGVTSAGLTLAFERDSLAGTM